MMLNDFLLYGMNGIIIVCLALIHLFYMNNYLKRCKINRKMITRTDPMIFKPKAPAKHDAFAGADGYRVG